MKSVGLGLLIVIVASLFQGSFVVPMVYVRSWKWENTWLVFTVTGMILFNWILGVLSIPNLISIYQSCSLQDIAAPAIFGLLWGIGAVCFGLGMAAVGLALGYAVIMGLVLSVGAMVPMLIFHPDQLSQTKGISVILGLLIMILGIAVMGYAGIRKEKDSQLKTGKITQLSTLSITIGLIICVLAGVFSAMTNVGYVLSKSLMDIALNKGVSSQWAGNSVWCILFTFGGMVNIAYCLFLLQKNKSYYSFKESFLFNSFLTICMGLMWIGSFVLYGLSASMMGDWGSVIGWSVFIALSIATAAVWGIVQGEWKEVSRKTLFWAIGGIFILICAICIFGYSSSL